MTREEIKALVCDLFEFGEDKFFDYEDEFIRFAALVAAHEREECAKVCESEATVAFSEGAEDWGRGSCMCAAAIRARSK